MEIKMRRARQEDAQAIGAIDAEMGGVMGLEIGGRPQEYYEEWLRFHRGCKRYPAFVGTSQDKVIWWVALGECPGGYPFDGVAVLEMGIPERLASTELTDLLLRFLEQQAIRLGHYKLMACLDAQQRFLLHTYRRVGFRDVGTLRSHGYRRGKLVDLVMMERLLPADMKALEEYYAAHYDFYRDYFDALHKDDAITLEEDLAPEYEEVETPEEQLPEGIVRFLRTKKSPGGEAVRRAAPAEEPGEGEEGQTSRPRQTAPDGPQLPEGIIKFLKSKKLPDGTPANLELPPIVPVKLTPAQRAPAQAVRPEEESGEEPAPPEPEEEESRLQLNGVKE